MAQHTEAGWQFHIEKFRRSDSVGTEDFYRTPTGATRALMARERLSGVVWEPACGDGIMSRVLGEADGVQVISSDMYDRGYGYTGVDFLSQRPEGRVDYIVTNPPYALAQDFIERSFVIAERGVMMLIKMNYLMGIKRQKLFAEHPPRRVWVFSLPIPYMKDGKWQRGGFGHCWFVWEKGYTGPTELNWIDDAVKE